MPPKRSSKRSATQSTLAFHGAQNARISKPNAAQPTAKSKFFSSSTPAKELSPVPDDSTIAHDAVEVETEVVLIPHPGTELVRTREKDDDEIAAEKITDARVRKYWTAKEKERVAKRVHQGDLSTEEKVLREFDVAAKFGPCIGIARMKRWKRAQRLGLKPPIEVLAVLVKKDVNERAYVDELMGTKFVAEPGAA